MENKKGLSTVVTTLIILLLVLVSLGIFWGVSSGIVTKTASQADLNAKCINANIQATKSVCNATTCNVTLTRAAGQGSDAVEGIKAIFINSAGTRGSIVGEAGDVAQLTGKIAYLAYLPTGITTPTKVEISVYLKDSTGKEFICPQAREFSFA